MLTPRDCDWSAVASIGRTLPLSADGLAETADTHLKFHTVSAVDLLRQERVTRLRSVRAVPPFPFSHSPESSSLRRPSQASLPLFEA